MGTNTDELKKIHDLDLDDYGDDVTLAQIRSNLVSCDDTIRTIAANPAFEGETQLAVNGALAQLQAEVRKWYAAVNAIKAERTTARDSMRTAKPKYDELPEHTSDIMDEELAIEDKRDRQAAEALSPMDTALTTSAAALRAIDLSRPEFDPNRQVNQTPLDQLPTSSAAGDGGGGDTASGSGAYGGGATGSGGAGSTAGYGGSTYGTGHAVPLVPTATGTAAVGTMAVTSASRLVPNSHTGYSVTQVDRFTSRVNGPASTQSTAFAAGRYTVENGRLIPLASASNNASVGGTGGVGTTGLVAGAVGTAGVTAATAAVVRGLSGVSGTAAAGTTAAAGATSAVGINGSTGMAATTAAQGSSTAGSATHGATGRPAMGAPAAGRGAGQSRQRRRPHGTYDIPLLEDEVQEDYIADPGVAGQAGSLETLSTPGWKQESDSW
ncbi:hypothetical protein [Actinomyces ruminis]|uniref:Uncharacterized protein n=1 Tax=Actinomyces ruminis TaxID=1937003 RepID=A0ABX4MBP3_9ACTO|nr:hypothetical protein [Actinomyces ruminis]PHP52894.1 hypothetical protein BW737_006450 [Actinomyces ruminis]